MRIVLLLSVLLLAACHVHEPAYTHEAYVWQRQWDSALLAAVRTHTQRLAGLRVLGLEIADARNIEIAVDRAAIANTGLPVRLVVRIEGSRPPADAAEIAIQINGLVSSWRGAGIQLAGVEIDHDCASAALGDYRRWLQQLKSSLIAPPALSITALPTWIGAPQLPALLAVVEQSVLQIHAVVRPDRALFDSAQTQLWARAYGEIAQHPYLLALPAYSIKVSTDLDGQLHSVDAEGDIDRGGDSAHELHADPELLAKLLQMLARDPPRGLAGYVWFRLPVSSDRRSLSAASFAAVIDGAALTAHFEVRPVASDAGALELFLHNRGNLDATAPARIELPASCLIADGLSNYRLERLPRGLVLLASRNRRLRSGEAWRIAWARCEPGLKGWTVNDP